MIRALLRERTHAMHERLVARIGTFERDSSLLPYTTLLEHFYGIVLPLEAQLASGVASALLAFDFTARRKAHLLERDLPNIATGSRRASTA